MGIVLKFFGTRMPMPNWYEAARSGAMRQLIELARHLRCLLADGVVGREQCHAARASQEMLHLHSVVTADCPALPPREIYLKVLMARSAYSPAEAAAILDCAEDSFAIWPVSRALTFRDVVHYVAVTEFFRVGGVLSIRSDLGHLVAELIPQNL
jgi:hypothetical protein